MQIILHNSVSLDGSLTDFEVDPCQLQSRSTSLDGSLTDFEVDMGQHYQIAGEYKADANLIGSNTIKKGVELYGEAQPEKRTDFSKPERDKNLPNWVIIDSKGILQGLLHEVRRFEFCKDVIVLISRATPKEYIEYLKDRKYDHHVVGDKQVDIGKALDILSEEYGVSRILVDAGSTLGNILLKMRLVTKISILVHPIIVGGRSHNMFRNIEENIELKLMKNKTLDNDNILLEYEPIYQHGGSGTAARK
jgi:2,5-diamino-6-(ribosylamino)-4(3H)-pyrimidinone 5'-phosphate reductase